MILLTAKLVERVIREEANKYRIDFASVLNASMRVAAVNARRSAIKRLMGLTGCRPAELAQAWGCEAATVRASLAAGSPPPCAYDDLTIQHLRWAHGEARAAAIVAGSDPKTRWDIAAWRALGARG